MELTVLGKYGPYGKAGTGAASGYLIKSGNDTLVCDMGSGTLSRLMSLCDMTKIRNIYISHLHYDHTSDLLPYRYLLEDIKTTVNIYTHFDNSNWFDVLFSHPNFNLINIDENSLATIGSIELSFLKMEHPVTDYAVRIKGEKVFCYTGDTVYNSNIPLLFDGADYVLTDCSKPENFKGPHMTVKNAKELAEKFPNTKIIATHHSVDYDPSDDLKDYNSIIIAEELKTYSL